MALASVTACAGAGPTAPIDRDTFVQVVADLRLAAREFPDTTEFDRRKAEILAAAGVTDSALTAFARAYGNDAEFMSEVWQSIDDRVNPQTAATDTTQTH